MPRLASLFATALVVPLFGASISQASLLIRISEGIGDSVLMTIEATGTVSAAGESFDDLMNLGTLDDSFLPNGQAPRQDLSVDPVFHIGSAFGDRMVYRDDDGQIGLESRILIQFDNGGEVQDGDDWSDLSGSYELSDWIYSDFIEGSYSLVSLQDDPRYFSGQGDITLVVGPIPEPSTLVLASLGLVLLGSRRPRQPKASRDRT